MLFCWSILNFGGCEISRCNALQRFERRYLHLALQKVSFFCAAENYPQRKGSMYEARCRLKFVAKCRLVSSFFFHFYGARCDGLSNYVQTCWNWDVFQDLVCWHWFWKKNIFRCQMVQPLFLRIQPCFPSDPTVFSSRFSCRCPIPAFLGKSRGENTFWRLTKRRGRRSKESDRKEEESGNGPSEITYFSDIEI